MSSHSQKKTDNLVERCPCIEDSFYKNEVSELLFLSASSSSDWDIHKIMAVYRLCFHYRKMEEELPEYPEQKFSKILADVTEYLKLAAQTVPPSTFQSESGHETEVEKITADHYGNLFSYFNDEKYYDEPALLLRQRLERNGFDLEWLKGKSVLDGGCGNGRYTYALSLLGAKNVVGYDMSETNLVDANKRLIARPQKGVSYQKGSVLEMPFEDGSFDFVFSNGVLHHTIDLDKGLSEVLRVLKVDGKGFLMLINDPGGIKWDMIEICRELLREVPYRLAHDMFLKINMPTHLRFLYLDHILVPVNLRLTADQIREKLTSYGAVNIERFNRGADVDEFEKFEGYSGKDIMWGAGIHRFVFSKAANI